MLTQTQRLFAILALGIAPLLVAQCGGGAGTIAGTSPTSTTPPSPSPSPTGTPPAPGNQTSSLSLTPSSIQGQGQPQGLVTLSVTAPAGGAVVSVVSSNTTVARVPSTVTVPAGARSATFVVDTSTVQAPTSVTITASYAGGTMTAALTVTPPAAVASFVVRSRTRGAGACVMEENTQELDCVLDGSASQGFLDAWVWTYSTATSQLGHTARDAISNPQISTKCAFLQTATGGDDPNGDRYLRIEVALQVQDKGGTRSAIVRQAVKLYPNRQCGFSY